MGGSSAANKVASSDSKDKLQSKLDQPLCPLERSLTARPLDPPGRRRTDLRRGIVELRRVRQVIELSAKLQPLRFADSKILEDREIHLPRPGPEQNVPAGIPPKQRSRIPECARVEPAVRTPNSCR